MQTKTYYSNETEPSYSGTTPTRADTIPSSGNGTRYTFSKWNLLTSSDFSKVYQAQFSTQILYIWDKYEAQASTYSEQFVKEYRVYNHYYDANSVPPAFERIILTDTNKNGHVILNHGRNNGNLFEEGENSDTLYYGIFNYRSYISDTGHLNTTSSPTSLSGRPYESYSTNSNGNSVSLYVNTYNGEYTYLCLESITPPTLIEYLGGSGHVAANISTDQNGVLWCIAFGSFYEFDSLPDHTPEYVGNFYVKARLYQIIRHSSAGVYIDYVISLNPADYPNNGPREQYYYIKR